MEKSFALLSLKLGEHGAQLFQGALETSLPQLEIEAAKLPQDHAGIRINNAEWLTRYVAPTGAIGAIAAHALGPNSRAVRAVLFDKTSKTNWSLNWHQDRTICVKSRHETDGFGPWTIKNGMQHVAPPFDLLTHMVTLRAHIDPVSPTNAPLLVALGSHTMGRISVEGIEAAVRQCKKVACLADAGDVWLYSTPILHASEAAEVPEHRRVLQVDFAAEELPGKLEWLGV